jgi:hypothetical protein
MERKEHEGQDLVGSALLLALSSIAEIAVRPVGGLALLEHVVGPITLGGVILVLLQALEESVVGARARSLLHLLLGLLDLLGGGIVSAEDDVLDGAAGDVTDSIASSHLSDAAQEALAATTHRGGGLRSMLLGGRGLSALLGGGGSSLLRGRRRGCGLGRG